MSPVNTKNHLRLLRSNIKKKNQTYEKLYKIDEYYSRRNHRHQHIINDAQPDFKAIPMTFVVYFFEMTMNSFAIYNEVDFYTTFYSF